MKISSAQKDLVIDSIKKKIDEIKDGKGERRMIIVSTQVIEASVNIDADYMITEIAPMDSLIQRFGRVYRNRLNDYARNAPNCYVIKYAKKDDDTNLDDSNLYNDSILNATLKILKSSVERPLSYVEEKRMVEEVYNDEDVKKLMNEQLTQARQMLQSTEVAKISEAQRIFRNIESVNVCIWDFLSEDTKEYIIEEPLEETAKSNAEAATGDKKCKQWLSALEDVTKNSLQLPLWIFKKYYYCNGGQLAKLQVKGAQHFTSTFFVEVGERNKQKCKEEGLESLFLNQAIPSEWGD